MENIKAIIFDVDGVLTDGSIIVDGNGVETKSFNAGLKISLHAAVVNYSFGACKLSQMRCDA